VYRRAFTGGENMDFWARRVLTLHGNEGTVSIFDTIARLALQGQPSGAQFTKTAADAAAGVNNPAVPDPVGAAAAATSATPAATPASNSPASSASQDIFTNILRGANPSYRQHASGDVYAVYNLKPQQAAELARQIWEDPRERYNMSQRGTVVEHEAPDGTVYQIYFQPGGKAQVARVLRDEEYEGLDPNKVRQARVLAAQAGGGGMPQFGGGDPFLMMLPMMYQMMMASDPEYMRTMQMQAMMWQQMMMRQMMMAHLMQQMKSGSTPFG